MGYGAFVIKRSSRIRRDAAPVRVPEVVLKSIGFVAEVTELGQTTVDLDFIGTAFIVSIPAEALRGYRFHYVVTARHVVDKRKTAVVVNEVGGGVKSLTFEFANWVFHPDRGIDVAIRPYVFKESDDITTFGLEDVFDEGRHSEQIGVGDQVFFPGLFVHGGISEKRTVPIVRHGNLAMLPTEEIEVNGNYVHVYLVEGHSIGGISGSPVFVRETISLRTTTDDGRNVLLKGPGEMRLLGLMHGHWDVKEVEKNEPQFVHAKHGVNMGIAIVIPSKYIMETINLPELVALRRAVEELKRNQITPNLDGSALS